MLLLLPTGIMFMIELTEYRDGTNVLLALLVASQKRLTVSNLAYYAFWVLFLLL